MKKGSFCFEQFCGYVDANFDVTLEEGKDYKVLCTDEIMLINKASEDFEDIFNAYDDAWFCALDHQCL